MPIAPYGPPRIAEQPLPGVRFSSDFPAEAGIGPSFQRVLGAGADIFAQAKKRADDTAVGDAELKLGALHAKLETEAMAQTGANAMGAYNPAMEAYAKGAGEIEGELRGGDQIRAFQNLAGKRQVTLQTTLGRHVDNETKKLEDGTFAARMALYAEDAGRDPTQADKAVADSYGALAQQGANRGWAKEQYDAAALNAASNIRSGVVTGLLKAGRNVDAQNYFVEHRDEFNAKDAEGLIPALNNGDLLGQAQSMVDDIRSTRMPDGTEPTLFDAIREIETRSSGNPKLRQMAEERARGVFNLDDQAKQAVVNDTVNQLYDAMRLTGGALDGAQEAALAGLPTQQETGLRALRAQMLAPKPIDPVKAANTKVKFLAMTREELKAVTPEQLLTEYQPYLKEEDFDQYALRWNAARGEKSAGPKWESIRTADEMVTEAIRKNNLGGKTDVTKTAERAGFQDDYDMATAAFFADTKRNPDPNERQKLVDRIALRRAAVLHELDWWNEDLKLIDISPARMGEITSADPDKAQTIEIPDEALNEFWTLAGDSRLIDRANVDKSEFLGQFRGRVNEAYIARLTGADWPTQSAIILGVPSVSR